MDYIHHRRRSNHLAWLVIVLKPTVRYSQAKPIGNDNTEDVQEELDGDEHASRGVGRRFSGL